MKKVLVIVILSLLMTNNLISKEITINGEKYNTGTFGFGADPYVIGCIYDNLDASFGKKCAHRSFRHYFNEGKYPGSWNRAFQKCQNELLRTGTRKYVNFRRGLNDGDYSIICSP